ncbi:MAG: hypothetical protein Q8K70_06040 [Bacteroidota bacterium]|nr:hypothetical protein [Bacteroidota bacterium]
MKSFNFKTLAWALLPALIIGFTACGDKDETPPTSTPTPNIPTTGTEQYILMNSKKVVLRNPQFPSIQVLQGDTILQWAGNKPSGIEGDTVVIVTHYEGVKRGVNSVSNFATDYGEISVSIFHGNIAASPRVLLTGGDFNMEKINGIWYSVLKNGTAVWKKAGGDVNLTGIEFRLAWPSTFK